MGGPDADGVSWLSWAAGLGCRADSGGAAFLSGRASDPPVSVVGLRYSTGRSARSGRSVAGPVPVIPDRPLVLDRAAGPQTGPPERQPSHRRNPGCSAIRSARNASGSQTVPNAVRSARHRRPVDRPGPAGPELAPQRVAGQALGPDACGGKTEDVCPPRTRVRQLATGRAPGCCADDRRPGCRCDRAATRPARPIRRQAVTWPGNPAARA